MTTVTAPIDQLIQNRQKQISADLTEARRKYADLIAALATDNESPLGNDDVAKLLSFLDVSDERLRADVERAAKIAAVRSAADSLERLTAAKRKASDKYDEWQAETERLIAEREPKRAELSGRFQAAEQELAAAERLSRQSIETAALPPAWQQIAAAISDCRTRSAQHNNRLHSAVESISRQTARLNQELASASAKDAEAIKAQQAELQTPFHADLQRLYEHWQHRMERFADFAKLIDSHRDPATGLWIGPDEPPAEWQHMDTSRLEIPEHLPA
ncbi:MAG: hypothetical protein Fues2KO_52850 [Fuerstiella sp.]